MNSCRLANTKPLLSRTVGISLIDPEGELPIEDQREMIQLLRRLANRPHSEMNAQYAQQDRQALTLSSSFESFLRCFDSSGLEFNRFGDR